jgi:transposase
MEHSVFCGLDVHKKSVVACVLRIGGEATVVGREFATFGTTTPQLRALASWLRGQDCKRVTMEGTGSYWKPIYNILEDEGGFELVVVNPMQVRQLRGRKTDIKDAELIAELDRQGALRPSNIPSREQRELREVVRYRTSLVQERSAEVNRIQKVLEGANIKLGSVATNVVGVSGREMLWAMVEGEENPVSLAEMARGRLKEKRPALEEALTGLVGSHQRQVLRRQLRRIAEFDRDIEELSKEIEERTAPFTESLERLQTIPGVGRRVAETFIAEVGTDLSKFPSGKHLASWVGVCPGMNESAGRNRSGRTPHGSKALKGVLTQAANVAARTDTYLGARHRSLRYRIGVQKATIATANRIVVIAYEMLTKGMDYDDRKPITLNQQSRAKRADRLLRDLRNLGYEVAVSAA